MATRAGERAAAVAAAAVLVLGAAVTADPASGSSRYLFRAPVGYDIGARATADGVAVDDIDGDGRLDVVVLTSADTPSLTMRRQQADGTLGPSEALAGYVSAWAMDTGDVNGDGRTDIVTGNYSGTAVRTQGPDGAFTAETLSADFRSYQVRVADVDGDGRDDVVSSGSAYRGGPATDVQVFLQDALGELAPAVRLAGAGLGGRGMDVADLDGDGLLDIVVVTEQGVGGYRQGADGTWTTVAPQAVRESPVPSGDAGWWWVGAGDFDHDGRDDAALSWGVEDPRLAVFRSNGVGFDPPTQVTLPDRSSSVRAGDLDGDGLDDVAVFHPDRNGVSVVAQGVDGLEATATTYAVDSGIGQYSDGLDVGDLDGDGLADLAVMGYFQTVQLHVLRHRGPDVAPSAPDLEVTTTRGSAVAVPLPGSDGGDGDPVTIAVDAPGPAHGTLSGRVPNLTFRPAAGFVGTDAFTYRVGDDRGGTATGTVTIDVRPVPPSPPREVTGSAENGRARLTWAPSEDDGGGAITGYEVHRDGALVGSTDGSTTEFVDDGLTYGTDVAYTVVAVNAGGRSAPGGPLLLSPADTLAPTISLSSPDGTTTYPTGAVVLADYTCVDDSGGSGVASCIGTVPNGAAVDTSTPGDHTFAVTASDLVANRSSVERRYAVADARPDGRIRLGRLGRSKGDDLYDPTGEGQTQWGRVARGRSSVYVVTAQNDAPFPDRLTLAGAASSARFRVSYVVAGRDVTDQIAAGTYTTPPVEAGGTVAITVRVAPRATIPVGAAATRRLTVSSVTHPLQSDTVRFVTRVVPS